MLSDVTISINQLIVFILILVIFFIFFILVLRNIKKVKNSVGETSKSNEMVGAKVDNLNQRIQQLNQDNQEVIKVHKQIKEKSEAMNKMLKQTNKIYKEVLDKRNAIETSESEFIDIDYDKLNQPTKADTGEHLTQLLNNINSDREQISKKIHKPEPVKKVQGYNGADDMTKIDIENIKRMSKNELEELFLTLKDYKIILNKEVDYYVEQIEQINLYKSSLSPSDRLSRKEHIYAEIKEVESKLHYQQLLMKEVKECKERIEKEEHTVEKEKELDKLINGIITKR